MFLLKILGPPSKRTKSQTSYLSGTDLEHFGPYLYVIKICSSFATGLRRHASPLSMGLESVPANTSRFPKP